MDYLVARNFSTAVLVAQLDLERSVVDYRMINFRRSRAPQVSELCRYRAVQFARLRQLLIITGRTSRKPCFWNFVRLVRNYKFSTKM